MIKSTLAALLFVSIGFSAQAKSKDPNAPIDRLVKVDDGFYRGAIIENETQMKQLSDLGVRTIVSMITDPKIHEIEQQLADKYGIQLVWIPVAGWNAPTDEQTKVIQQWLNYQAGRPVYLHCTHGRDRTGIQTALYRVWTNKWSAMDAYEEAKARGFRSIIWPMRKYYKRVSGYYIEEEAKKKAEKEKEKQEHALAFAS